MAAISTSCPATLPDDALLGQALQMAHGRDRSFDPLLRYDGEMPRVDAPPNIEVIRFGGKHDWTARQRKTGPGDTYVLAWGLMLMVEILRGSGILTWTGISRATERLIVLAALLAFGGILLSRYFRWEEWRRRVRLLSAADPSEPTRLWCIGLPADLQRTGEFHDVAFEPVIFNAKFALQDRFPSRTTARLSWLVLLFSICITNVLFRRGIVHTIWDVVLPEGILPVFLAMGITFVVFTHFNPIYLRIVPGRLDVMQFSSTTNRVLSYETYDLRKSQLIVDLPDCRVLVNDGTRTLEFSTAFISGRKRLAHTLFLAAVSTHRPAPLPDDALLG